MDHRIECRRAAHIILLYIAVLALFVRNNLMVVAHSSSDRLSYRLFLSLVSPVVTSVPSNNSSIIADDNKSSIPGVERTFVMIKPDAVDRALVGEIIRRMESKGLRLIAMKMMRPDRALAEKLYEIHRSRPFFNSLIDFIVSGTAVVAMVWQSSGAVPLVRMLIGQTHPDQALPGTIRGDYCFERGKNLIHSSDSIENAAREINLFFDESELIR